MTTQMLLAAVKPWTYWFAPPLLVARLVLIVALAVGYDRKVMIPAFLWRIRTRSAVATPQPMAA